MGGFLDLCSRTPIPAQVMAVACTVHTTSALAERMWSSPCSQWALKVSPATLPSADGGQHYIPSWDEQHELWECLGSKQGDGYAESTGDVEIRRACSHLWRVRCH